MFVIISQKFFYLRFFSSKPHPLLSVLFAKTQVSFETFSNLFIWNK